MNQTKQRNMMNNFRMLENDREIVRFNVGRFNFELKEIETDLYIYIL